MNRNNQPTNYVFDGRITTLGPLSTTLPGIKPKQGAPMPMPRAGNKLYMPGGAIKGLLRDHGTRIQLAAHATRGGDKIDLFDFFVTNKGGVKQGGDQDTPTTAETDDYLARNLVVALHGASTPWIAGKLMVGNAFCDDGVEPMVVTGVRKDNLRDPIRRAATMEFLTPESEAEWQSMLAEGQKVTAIKKDTKKLRHEAATTENGDEKNYANEKIRENEAQTKGNVNIQMLLAGYEAIPPGIELSQRMVLRQANEVELGFLLASLNHFAVQAPLLGAHAGTGGGEFSAAWEVSANGETLGSVSFDPWLGLSVIGEPLKQALAAFENHAGSQSMDPRPSASLREKMVPKVAKEKNGQGR